MSSVSVEDNNFTIIMSNLTCAIFTGTWVHVKFHRQIPESVRGIETNQWSMKKVVAIKRGWLLINISYQSLFMITLGHPCTTNRELVGQLRLEVLLKIYASS